MRNVELPGRRMIRSGLTETCRFPRVGGRPGLGVRGCKGGVTSGRRSVGVVGLCVGCVVGASVGGDVVGSVVGSGVVGSGVVGSGVVGSAGVGMGVVGGSVASCVVGCGCVVVTGSVGNGVSPTPSDKNENIVDKFFVNNSIKKTSIFDQEYLFLFILFFN